MAEDDILKRSKKMLKKDKKLVAKAAKSHDKVEQADAERAEHRDEK
jgi:hypothetical protein